MASRETTLRINVEGVPQVVAALNRAAAELDRMATELGGLRPAALALATFVDEQMSVYDEHDPHRPSYATVPWDDIAKLGELADAVLAAGVQLEGS